MALATRCPSCGTVFRISTAQAAAKGGMVRCGLCRGVFDSLDALVRVEDLDVIDEVDVAVAATADAASSAEAMSSSDAAGSGDADVQDGAVTSNDAASPERGDEVPPDGGALVATPVGERSGASVDALATEPAPREWWLSDVVPRGDAIVVAERPDDALSDAEATGSTTSVGTPAAGRRTDPVAAPVALDSTHPTFMRPDPATTDVGRAARWTYGLLSLGAALGLVAQAAYFWRDELAARFPPARSVLTAVCQPLRCVVDDPAHADAISIESASVQASGPNLDVYVMTGLLRNRDPIDVRYPHLELVLTDLQDRPILRRALRPDDYLPPLASRDGTRGGFPAQSELPIRVAFELNGLRFVGYRLDRFYP